MTFDFDWIDPQGARGEELRATWASFQIGVDGTPITRIHDLRSKTVRDHVFAPLYPLAEWIATNWWRLLNEPLRPTPIGATVAYNSRSLAAAREGFAYPDLTLDALGEEMRLSWRAERLPHADVEFLGTGESFLPISSAAFVLRSFISAVVARLDQQDVTGTLLQEEWATIEATFDEERDFCVAAAALGLDPYAVTDLLGNLIELVGNSLPVAIRYDFFCASSPSTLEADANYIRLALDVAAADRTSTPRLTSLRNNFRHETPTGKRSLRSIASYPWEQGYATARQLRQHLGLKGRPLRTTSEITAVLGAAEHQVLRPVANGRVGFDAILGYNQMETPHIVVPPRQEETTRFQICRALFEYLSSDSLIPVLLTNATTVAQQRSRAFAAEFLAPSESIRAEVSSDSISSYEVDQLAAHFGVSWLVLEHQLENHNIAHIST